MPDHAVRFMLDELAAGASPPGENPDRSLFDSYSNAVVDVVERVGPQALPIGAVGLASRAGRIILSWQRSPPTAAGWPASHHGPSSDTWPNRYRDRP